jgi:UDP-2-acetamido-3-amino-2,3-dideoxy-glucuronate N-acetyltransferase
LKELIKKGRLGIIQYIWSNRLNFGKLRKEENVLWSFAPHDISVIIDIMGMPEAVSTVGKTFLQKNIPDTTVSFLEFRSGKAAHIFVSWLNPCNEHSLTIIGSEGMAVFDDQGDNPLIFYPHKIKINGRDGNLEARKNKGVVIACKKQEPLKEEMRHFLSCLQTRKPPLSDGAHALKVLKILSLCQRSLEQEGKPKKL